MIRSIVIGSIFFLFCQILLAQETSIKIDVEDEPLNVVLLQLRDHYDIRLSYSDNELSKYKVTISETFNSKEAALRYVLNGLPFQLKKSNDVFIIVQDKNRGNQLKKGSISGQIVESGTYEPLSFSSVIINKHQMYADVSGSFNYTDPADSTFNIQISHLGYYILDTTVYNGANQKIELIPSVERLPEITVQNNVIEKAALIGEEPANMKLNHNISRFLAGQSDNSVFNLLRLMPGIQATNEQNADLQIWGSYDGQSLITFDEITLFGLKDYNSNISIINPSIVKNIEIYKGGYEARFGNRVGGLVNIIGKNGSQQKPIFNFSINLMTLNAMVEMPLFEKSSLLLAYRQTYYNPYNMDDFSLFGLTIHGQQDEGESRKESGESINLNVFPNKYQFRDFNAKYTYYFDNNDQLSLSAYIGGDNFSLETFNSVVNTTSAEEDDDIERTYEFSFSDHEKNRQQGVSISYLKNWQNGNLSRIIFSHSNFTKEIKDSIQSRIQDKQPYLSNDLIEIENEANENSVRIENIISFQEGHQVEFGGGFYANHSYIEDTNTYIDTLAFEVHNENRNHRGFAFLQDNLPLPGGGILRGGVRVNFADNLNKLFVEPRLSISKNLNESFKFNASWGIFNQFMRKTAYVDRDQNYTYLWITNNESSKVLNATHWDAGVNFFKNDFTVNIEGYYKTTRNLTRYVLEPKLDDDETTDRYTLYTGDSKSLGIDCYVKKDFGRHSIWVTYTLSKVVECLASSGDNLPGYQSAPHDQRHEFKIAGIFNINKFYFSANYIYGSGMYILKQQFEDENQDVSYRRLDAALTYKLNWKKLRGETGISVLNVLNTRNLVRSNLRNININNEIGAIRISSDAMPLTPILFLKVVF